MKEVTGYLTNVDIREAEYRGHQVTYAVATLIHDNAERFPDCVPIRTSVIREVTKTDEGKYRIHTLNSVYETDQDLSEWFGPHFQGEL
jgi:hypothetical protein